MTEGYRPLLLGFRLRGSTHSGDSWMSGPKLKRVAARGLTWLAATLLLAGCSLFSRPADPVAETTETTSTPNITAAQVETVTTAAEVELTVDLFNDGVFCDGTDQRAAILFGAVPGETIAFESPMPVDIPDGVADNQGTFQLQWQCEPHETALFWDVTASTDSGGSIDFRIQGAYTDPAADRVLEYAQGSTPLFCDGVRRIIGYVTKAEPLEAVTFSSPEASSLVGGSADAEGRVEVYWQCLPEDTGRSWSVRAAGTRSGRSVTFDVTGEPPVALEEGPIQVEMLENPFTCDRSRRPVAKLSNVTPRVQVEFEASPSAGQLDSARANGDGDLTLYWLCDRSQDGTEWTITAVEQTTVGTDQRSASIAFAAVAPPNRTAVSLVEDPFICDGTRHPVATLSNFLTNEFIDFTSPQSEGLRQGQADADGGLTVNWQCTTDDVGKQWEVTATGATSGVDITFTITAAAPAD